MKVIGFFGFSEWGDHKKKFPKDDKIRRLWKYIRRRIKALKRANENVAYSQLMTLACLYLDTFGIDNETKKDGE